MSTSQSKEKKGRSVAAKCKGLTATWIREKANTADIELCDFYEVWKVKRYFWIRWSVAIRNFNVLLIKERKTPRNFNKPIDKAFCLTVYTLWKICGITGESKNTVHTIWLSRKQQAFTRQGINPPITKSLTVILALPFFSDTLYWRYNIQLPLLAWPESCGIDIKRTIERLHCCIWRGTQHWYSGCEEIETVDCRGRITCTDVLVLQWLQITSALSR